MTGSPARNGPQDVTCPHCSRVFRAELLAGPAERYSGFKCPYCKLFVPAKRVGDVTQPAE